LLGALGDLSCNLKDRFAFGAEPRPARDLAELRKCSVEATAPQSLLTSARASQLVGPPLLHSEQPQSFHRLPEVFYAKECDVIVEHAGQAVGQLAEGAD